MIKRILSLTSLFFKSSLRSSFIKDGKKFSWGMVALVTFSLLYVTGLVIYFSGKAVTFMQMIHQEELFLGYVLLGNMLLAFLQTILTIPNLLYFSKDNNYMLPLPFSPKEIVLSKFLLLWLYELSSCVFFTLIPLLRYGMMTGQGFGYYPLVLLVIILLPIVPILLATCLMMVVLSFLKLTRFKAFFQIISTILVLALSIGFSFFMSATSSLQQDPTLLFVQGKSLVNLLRPYFPTFGFALDSLLWPSWLVGLTSLTLLVASSVLMIIIAIFVGEKFYFRGLIGALYGSSIMKHKTVKAKDYHSHSIFFSYIKKEWLVLIHTPVYFSQLVLPAVLLPIFYFAIFLYGFFQSGMDVTAMRTAALYALEDASVKRIIFLSGIGIYLFASMYIYFSITAFSRDGAGAIYSKQLPIPMWLQVLYKSFWNWVFIVTPVSLFYIGITIYLQITPWLSLLIILAGFLYAFGHSVVLTLFDLRKPRLHWTSEIEVVKTNLRIFLSSIYPMMFAGILIALGFWVKNYYLCLLLCLLILLGVAVGVVYYCYKHERKIGKGIC